MVTRGEQGGVCGGLCQGDRDQGGQGQQRPHGWATIRHGVRSHNQTAATQILVAIINSIYSDIAETRPHLLGIPASVAVCSFIQTLCLHTVFS